MTRESKRPGPPSPGQPKIARGWGHAHDLVNMYLAIALLADNDLDPEEQRTFMRRFGGWMPNVTLDEFEKVWGEVMSLNDSLGSGESRYALYLQSVINILEFMGDNKDNLRGIVRDLADIAGADKELLDKEITLIKAAAITFGLSADLRVNANTGRVELVLREAN